MENEYYNTGVDGFSQDIIQQDENSQDGGGDNGSAKARGRDNDRKLFVGGLSWETTAAELREHFSKYGDIESIHVKMDQNTGRSRGFAFIVFSQSVTIDKVMADNVHVINNKKVDPKKVKARPGKIFVGGLSNQLTKDDIKNFFSQFGTIVSVDIPMDKEKNQYKNFGFVTFESEDVVKELLKTPKQTICGNAVDVKKAIPNPNDPAAGMRGGRGAARGRGGGYGTQSWTSPSYGSQDWSSQRYGGDFGFGSGYGSGYASGYDYGGAYGTGYTGYSFGDYDYGSGNYTSSYTEGRGSRGRGSGGKQRGSGRNQRPQPY